MSDVLTLERLGLHRPREDGAAHPLLRDVSLTITEGESVGLVGESGSGKSLTARSVVGLIPSGFVRTGSVRIGGRDIDQLTPEQLRRVRGNDVAMIFQNPRAHVNPVRTVEDHITEPLRFLRSMSRRVARARALELLDSVLIREPHLVLDRYPHELSGGMLQRVMIAGALAQEPRLLLADEPTTALDVTTQAEVVAILTQLRKTHGMAMLFITHDLELAAAISDRTAVMYSGTLVEIQQSADLERQPLHPYTAALQQARPSLSVRARRLSTIPGAPRPDPGASVACDFADRCAYAVAACRESSPPLVAVGNASVACFRASELALTGQPDGDS